MCLLSRKFQAFLTLSSLRCALSQQISYWGMPDKFKSKIFNSKFFDPIFSKVTIKHKFLIKTKLSEHFIMPIGITE